MMIVLYQIIKEYQLHLKLICLLIAQFDALDDQCNSGLNRERQKDQITSLSSRESSA